LRPAGLICKGGTLNLRTETDSTLNLLNTFSSYNRSKVKTTRNSDFDPVSILKQVEIFDFEITQYNELTKENLTFRIDSIKNIFHDFSDTSEATISGHISFNELSNNSHILIKDQLFKFEIDYLWNKNNLNGILKSGHLSLGEIKADVKGKVIYYQFT